MYMKNKLETSKPLLLLLYGFPGSGKTHFARNLVENLRSAHVHGDRIRAELFEEPQYDRQENGIITQLMQYMTEEFLSAGVSVIYDYTTIRKSQRAALREMARKKGANTLTVWFQMDEDSAFIRTNNRDRRRGDDKYAVEYTQEMFKKYVNHMQHPEMRDEYVVVSGKHTYPSQQTSFFKKLIEEGYIVSGDGQSKVAKPGMINLIPRNLQHTDRTQIRRRNINIR